jgi:hypothetical protein
MWLLTLQPFKNSIDTQEKLRLNLHSLSVSKLLEYRRMSVFISKLQKRKLLLILKIFLKKYFQIYTQAVAKLWIQINPGLFLCKQVVTRLLSSRYQDVFALLVPSCCNKSGPSCYHLVTKLMTVTDSQQIVPTRLIQAVLNKFLRACCCQLVNNLLITC